MLAIICGGGQYPYKIAEYCLFEHIPFVLAFINSAYDESYNWPNVAKGRFNLGEIGKLLDFFTKHNVSEVIFAGHVKRPNLFDLSLDKTAQKWLFKLGASAFKGDDGLLTAIAELFTESGISVISPQQFMNSLTTDQYILTIHRPSNSDFEDISKGISILSDLSKHDIGQSIVVENGLVIGIECVEGTDSLISRSQELKKYKTGGVLVKLSKDEQDLRFDMPTIGIHTLEKCHKAGFSGIAVERKSCIILNKDECIQFADQNNMFIIGVDNTQILDRGLYA